MFNPKTKIYLIIASFLILFVLLSVFIVSPLLAKIKSKSQTTAMQKSALALIEEQLSVFEDSQNRNSAYQKSASAIQNSIIPKDAPIAFMEFIESQATLFNLSLVVSPESLGKDPKYHSGFKIVVEGPFAKCLLFLARLEKSSWLFEISRVAITRYSEVKTREKENPLLKIGDVSMSLSLKSLAVSQPSSLNDEAAFNSKNEINSKQQENNAPEIQP